MTAKSTIPFVNREKEVELIQSKLEAFQEQKRVFDFILAVSGIPGIGKTTLLGKAQEEAHIRGIPSIQIDYEHPLVKNNPIYLLQHVAEQSFKSLTSWKEVLQDYQEHEGHPVQPAYYQERLIDTFVVNFKVQLEQAPLLLLIDNSHYMSELAKEILEDVLERVYSQNRLLIILAGRADIRWSSFELRRRTRSITLTPFPKTENAKLVPDPSYLMLTDQVYNLTRGYPKASVLAYQWVADHLEPSEVSLVDHFKAHEAELVFDLFDSIFVEYILHNIEAPETRQRLSKLLRYVSPLRRFDHNLLSELLRKLNKEHQFNQIDALTAHNYIRQMAALTYLVKWDSARQAYALDTPMRQLLSLEMKFRDRPQLLQIHQFVVDWYLRAINVVTNKDPSTPQSVVYLIEYIYHFAQLWHLEDKSGSLEVEVRQKIADLFKGYYMRERVHFQEEFNKDEDLVELLGDAYNRLIEFVARQVELEG